ncbi:MAG TPA: hypothetical protein VGG36_03355 [Rhizomicrobium sp.]|jgi:hypothetical protein
MNKLPVGKTISSAYAFTFSQLGSIIGLAWISLVAIGILQFLPYAAGAATVAANPLQEGQRAIQNMGISILVLLLSAIVYVAVTRLALGQKPGGAIAHFALGVAEFRTFGAIFLLGLAIVGISIGLAIVIAVIGGTLGASHNQAVLALTILVLAIAVICAVAYIGARLGFVLVPATVVEEHISLSRGWTLTQGNFWRIVAVLLAVTIPIFLVECIAVAVVMGPDLLTLIPAGPHGDPQALSAHMEEIIGRHAPVLIGLRLVFAPFQFGLGIGASAFGYRTLTAAAPQ